MLFALTDGTLLFNKHPPYFLVDTATAVRHFCKRAGPKMIDSPGSAVNEYTCAAVSMRELCVTASPDMP